MGAGSQVCARALALVGFFLSVGSGLIGVVLGGGGMVRFMAIDVGAGLLGLLLLVISARLGRPRQHGGERRSRAVEKGDARPGR